MIWTQSVWSICDKAIKRWEGDKILIESIVIFWIKPRDKDLDTGQLYKISNDSNYCSVYDLDSNYCSIDDKAMYEIQIWR